MSLSENKGLWLALAVAAILVGVLLWVLLSSKPFVLVVLFNDVGDLKRGNPVQWKGFTIGKVDRIEPLVDNQIGVTIRLREDYADRVTHGTEFLLKRASLMGLVGENAIELTTPAAPGTPFSSGEKVQGKSESAPTLLEDGKRVALEFWQQLEDRTNRLREDFQDSPFRKEAAEALKELGVLAEKGAEEAREGVDQFRKDHRQEIDRMLKKLEELRDKLRHAGDQAGAQRVEKEIESLKGLPPKR
jgi:ABC-type transporter Mla subunit MlaD